MHSLRSAKARVAISIGLALAAFFLFNTAAVEASSEVMEQQLEEQMEHRFWEVRTELHRIHHHLEFVPYMSFASVGILVILAGMLAVRIVELNRKR